MDAIACLQTLSPPLQRPTQSLVLSPVPPPVACYNAAMDSPRPQITLRIEEAFDAFMEWWGRWALMSSAGAFFASR